jgi:tetratricopeptide (TPR) repeat protein
MQGKLEEAVRAFRKAIELRPDSADAHYGLGHALRHQGLFVEALASYRKSHELGSKQQGWPYPSAEWIRLTERLAGLGDRLPALLKGEAQPADAGERLALAVFCGDNKKRYAAAARWYAEAFEVQPDLADDLQGGHRYAAACAAALAGCGQAADANGLPDKERSRLRQKALYWLRGDLSAWRALLAQGPDQRLAVGERMQHWLTDPDLIGVRGPEALRRLPEAERRHWQRFWQLVEQLRDQATAQPGTTRPSGQ